MPLRQHPHHAGLSPWNRTRFHSAWTSSIMAGLNKEILPPHYYALPNVHVGNQAQVDIAAVHDEQTPAAEVPNGAVATAVWAPPHPPLVVASDLADLDVFEITIVEEETGYRLVAAIELVSPANKDRPSHRQAFVAKCAAYLQNQIGVVIVDIITERRANLHAELMHLLQLGDEAAAAATGDLYAVAYRAVTADDRPSRLEIWPAPLAVGSGLPTLPLWIGAGRAVPLDLEASYEATCESLRIS
jgi:hypothetical protein